MNVVKHLVRTALLSAPGLTARRVLPPATVTIMMFHRFTEQPGDPRSAHTQAELRALLREVRRHRIPVVSLGTLAREESPPPRHGGVVFTVDDGYADFVRVAWPIFREFDCPVTVFLTTGFLDGELWPWWERVSWAFDHTPAATMRLRVADQVIERRFEGVEARRSAADDIIEQLKRVPDGVRETALAALPDALAVSVPADCPPEHAPMSWDDVRQAGREGATFGPHTVSHPILSRVDDARAELEVGASWKRVRAETDAAIPVFCYPNGDRDSFGPREEAIVASHGFAFALSAMPGSATVHDFAANSPRRFRIPRYGCPRSPRMLRWLASGWTRVWSREGTGR